MTAPTEVVYSVLKYIVPGNLIALPNEQDDSYYLKGPNLTVTADTTTAPDGTLTADTIDDQDATFESSCFIPTQAVDLDNTLRYATIYIKQGTANESRINALLIGGTGVSQNSIIDWTASPPTASVGTFTVDDNGFYKLVLSLQNDSTNNQLGFLVYPAGATASNTGTIISWGWSVSTDVPGRAYNILMPQNPTVPAITFQKVSAERGLTMADAGGNGVERDRIRITNWAKTLSAAQAVAEQVRLAMKAATTFEALQVFEADDQEIETLLYSVVSDYSVWYKY